jgi:hypothetical protein
MRFLLAPTALIASTLAFAACSGASNVGSGFTGKDGGSSTGPSTGDDGGTIDGGEDPGHFGDPIEAGPPPGQCSPSPANYDVPGDNCDNDGDGKIDNAIACDTGLTASGDAMAFAKSIGLCQTASATDTKWGVISATFTNGHTSTKSPNDAQHGILGKFGNVVKPREGAMFGVISSGSATEEDTDMGPAFKGFKNGMQPGSIPGFPGGGLGGDAPTGYPKTSPGCGTVGIANTVNDVINVKLQIRVPVNAKGLAFDFDFWSGEWPEFVCTTFNDSFIAYLGSKAFNNGAPENMSFDAKNNPVSVNNGFFDRCTPNTMTGCAGQKQVTAACPGGAAELAGTGFEDVGSYCGSANSTGGGATGWLTSQAPVQGGEVITLEFMIWDTGDSSYDSSVIIDNFQWQGKATPPGTGRPPPK